MSADRLAMVNSESTAYAGDVTAKQAWDALQKQNNALLIDVRTQPEWVFSGLPNLAAINNKKTVTISWRFYPTMDVNPRFVEMVKAVAPDPNTPIYFLCKTGGRSMDAAIAMTGAGYTQCFNVESGFEGDKNETGQRGRVNGWKAADLPWEQA